jgi:hypothetical protein
MRFLIAVLLLAGAAGAQVRERRLEELVQELRPLEERFVQLDVAALDPDEISSIFHELWVKTRLASRLARADAGLAKDFDAMAADSLAAARAADQIDRTYYRRGGWPRGTKEYAERLARTRKHAVIAVQHADRAIAALERIMRRFPLHTGTLEWGPRPLPPARPGNGSRD